MGIDVDAGTRGLFQQQAQIFQIVAGDQDRLARHRAHVDRGRLWVAKGTGFATIQNSHHAEVHFADGHRVVQ
ncbi:hypothetical protein D3C78_1586380 [compost metagenome]